MGSSSSKSNISTFGLIGTIRANPQFDAEESAKNVRKALKSKPDYPLLRKIDQANVQRQSESTKKL